MPATTAWLSVWAKSIRDDHGDATHWLPLHQHLADTEAAAGRLVDKWVSEQVLDRIARDVPDGVRGVRTLACWLAGVHDVGKSSPAFVVQVPRLADAMRANGLVASPLIANDPVRRQVSHALVGHRVVQAWLVDELGFGKKQAAQWAAVVGSHHGVAPEHSQFQVLRDRSDLVGTGPWQQARVRFLERATEHAGGKAALQRYGDTLLSKPSQVLLTAIVILADWIASNSELFPLDPIATSERPPVPFDEQAAAEHTARRLERGWTKLDLPARWSAHSLDTDIDQVFRDRFNPVAQSARPVQIAAVEVARAQTTPGLIVIEAPMGAGKTEAALLAAEQLAYASGADGCFLALPTQATSDAMFGRVTRWLDALPGRDSTASTSVYLAHGKATLNDEFRGLVRAGHVTCVGDEQGASLIAHEWLTGRKKGVLASFVVGTIDQVLFAGLKSRHLMLRHLALAGKVVIIDEVHAYDVYMSQYLHRVLHWLGAYGVPVVLLSATLPTERRAELLHAYASGSGDTSTVADDAVGYPVVVGTGGLPPRAVQAPATSIPVHLDHLDDDLDTLVTYLRTQLKDGGCAVVVRNTVGRVQDAARRLEEEFGADQVTVNHSRFLACDRARIDKELLARFGPPGPNVARPSMHIVVASQVVEQSLDIDFDLMVTDLAPVDLVLQRLGRLHRHSRSRPTPLREARCALVGVEDWASDPVQANSGSRSVYGEHTLLRAAAMLGNRARKRITLPEDISPLVQQAYGDEPVGPQQWQSAMEQARTAADTAARDRTDRAREFLLGLTTPDTANLIGWVRAGIGDPDNDHRGLAQVRDGEETLEVLVVQGDEHGGLCTPDWITGGAGEPIPTDLPVSAKQARIVAACGLRLPRALCHPGVIDDVIAALETNQILSFHQSPLLTGQLVLILDSERTAVLKHRTAHFRLTYDPRQGLMHERG